MSRISTILAALADTALAVAVGVLVPLAIGTIGWFASGSYQSVDWEVTLTVALAIWTLGLNSAVGIEIQPRDYPALGLAEPYGFVFAIAPLAVTALIAWFAYRTGLRILNDDEDEPWLAFAASVFAFPLINFAAISMQPAENVRLEPTGVLVGGSLLWLGFVAIGLRVWEYVPWAARLGDATGDVLQYLRESLRNAAGYISGLAVAATALMIVVLFLRFGEVIGLMQMLQLDGWGVSALGLAQLAYLPTFVVWAMSWMLGAGFDLGVGSHAGPGGTEAGPLPVLPMFGLIPDGIEPYWWAILAVPVAIAAAFVFVSRMFGLVSDAGTRLQRAVAPLGGAAVAAIAMWLLAYLSQGGIGPGRLVQFGPNAGLVLVASLGLFAVGGLTGAFVPLHAVDPGREPDADRRDADAHLTEPVFADEQGLPVRRAPRTRTWRDRIPGGFAPWDDADDSDRGRDAKGSDHDATAEFDLDEFAELDRKFGGADAKFDGDNDEADAHPTTDLSDVDVEVGDRTDQAIAHVDGEDTFADAANGDAASANTRRQRSTIETDADPGPSRPSRGRRDSSLRDVLDRPGEPDIYADLD
ncbi:cell division protein PerM [Gulosibacter bifidus]|uniref:DUF6350 family protein n=1 Tax=Gulosibacter bifidus TaxID=272239 RepID=A0ABW5RHB2_9MICO|nr:DUF6350 family protein [Gulosibacter bifidus]